MGIAGRFSRRPEGRNGEGRAGVGGGGLVPTGELVLTKSTGRD